MSQRRNFDDADRAAVLAMVASYQSRGLRRADAVWRAVRLAGYEPTERTVYRWLRAAGLTTDYRGLAAADYAISRRIGSPMGHR